MKRKIITLFTIMLINSMSLYSQGNELLQVESDNEVGQIEVGGPFVGIEIHKSFPMINRISFYYPVANSIDISEDYWKRENFRIMSMGIRIDEGPKILLKEETWDVIQTPYNVEFNKVISESELKIKYEFCKTQPAMTADYIMTNNSVSSKFYEVYLRYETVLRTSHTYDLFDNGISRISGNDRLLTIDYDYIQTGHSKLFFYNAGEQPEYSVSNFSAVNYSGPDEYWLKSDKPFVQAGSEAKPYAIFVFKKELKPGESLNITQLIGSAKISEAENTIKYLLENYREETAAYENYIISNSVVNEIIKTGSSNFDFTTNWALAVMKANAHYLDGEILPMPAQAEYNFYFTHDALLTDLATVYFDLDRVKNDLQFIINHADENNVIPHAYYWKDTEYKTEYAGTENWNHFWFTLLSARYFRHSGDVEFVKQLYPFVKKSIETALKNKENNLMCSNQPDWWDIGNNHGPRAYMTILAIRALHEFGYMQSGLNSSIEEIKYYQNIADTLQANLISELWNNELNYLTNYFNDGTEDKHIYMGSMLASHFDLLSQDKNKKLMQTAKTYLLDEKLGVYTLFPMDLHKLTEYMGFVENEAGQPHYYANGGIWPHGNAWYALGLISNKKYDEAYNFINRIMTMDGVINSPNGQPAMYEYRISDKSNPNVYGKIDKPQFLWAAGWYIYSLYHLLGVNENIWNISIQPFLPAELDSVNFSLTVRGNLIPVNIKGKGHYASSIMFKGKLYPSYILPETHNTNSQLDIEMGELTYPIITKAGAKLINAAYFDEKKTLSFETESYPGNLTEIKFISPFQVERIINNNKKIDSYRVIELKDKNFEVVFNIEQNREGNKIEIIFK